MERAYFDVMADGDHRVTGVLNTGLKRVAIEIIYSHRFSDLRTTSPNVFCREDWMRDEDDWHNSNITGMCWILANVWHEYQGWPNKPRERVVADGVLFLIEFSKNLINRHWVGHRRGLKNWKPEWKCFGHHEEGVKEYLREQKHAK
jgi:hypothetical protein